MIGNTLETSVPDASLERSDLLKMTSEVVAAYLGNHAVPEKDVPLLIGSIYKTFEDLSRRQSKAAKQGASKAAVPVKRSITPDYIVCLEDGKKLKMLKRHLRTNYDMTPEEYRAKWGLPPDYPMVAPNYAAQRSAFAKRIGLGKNVSDRPTR